MIYDCFIFNNELDILDIRLHELYKVVDKFVLVEATVTHTNKSKELYFQKNKELFKKFNDKIIHIVVKDMPNIAAPWILNDYQFSAIMRGLTNCNEDDIILIGDVDEIPKAEKIAEAKRISGRNKIFEHRISWYYLNNVLNSRKRWNGTHMVSYKDLLRYKTPWIAKHSRVDAVIKNGGWHFTWMGGVKAIQEKLSSTIRQELNTDQTNTPEKIKLAILQNKDPFNMGMKFAFADINFLPKYVKENRKKFKNLLLEKKQKTSVSNLDLKILNLKHNLRLYFMRPLKRNLNKLFNL